MEGWTAILIVAIVIVSGFLSHSKFRSFRKVSTTTNVKNPEDDEQYRDGDHCWDKKCGAQHSVRIKTISRLDTLGIRVDGTASFASEKEVSFALEGEDQIMKAYCMACGREKFFNV